jgi:ABC-2 type transport system permease protein
MAAVPARRRGLVALARRETARVLKLWTQTVAAPILSSFLFIVVFGLSLGTRIDAVDGISYDMYIVPGLITMAMVQAAYSNNASSIFQARFERYINDVLSAPMRPWEVNLGITLGGVMRALLVGAGLFMLSLVVTEVPVREPLVLVAAVALLVALFGSLGIVVGIYAETFDHHMAVNSIAILPLAFLGGVFYSIESLPSPWQELSLINPLFHLVQAVRFGFLGVSDEPVGIALGVTAVLTLAVVAWSSRLFSTGHRLKA